MGHQPPHKEKKLITVEVEVADDEADNDYEAEEESIGEDIGKVGKKQKRKLRQDDIDSNRKTTALSGMPAIKNYIQKGKGKEMGREHGLIPGWRKASTTEENSKDENTPIVQYGGIISDDKSDKVQCQAVATRVLLAVPEWISKAPLKKMTKIEVNPEAQPKTLKEAHGGDDKWVLKHLLDEAHVQYTNKVVPLVCKKAGSLNPWESFTVEHVQSVVNEVFGKGTYKVKSDRVWYGLTMSRLQNWHNRFAQSMLDTINAFIEEYKSDLNSPKAIVEQMEILLKKTKISTTNSEQYMFAYQWVEWGNVKE
ncbi:hypothetical protein APHAL10511_001390 [Amanita phalloides]|nr:hypothetical protein APHAL10511_001390 [Amanita phalloides]